jgi:hypothetical protein
MVPILGYVTSKAVTLRRMCDRNTRCSHTLAEGRVISKC